MTTMMRDVRKSVPTDGSVMMLELTDLQYEAVLRLKSGRSVAYEKPSRLVMF